MKKFKGTLSIEDTDKVYQVTGEWEGITIDADSEKWRGWLSVDDGRPLPHGIYKLALSRDRVKSICIETGSPQSGKIPFKGNGINPDGKPFE